jgi:hypothetical protein
MKSLLLGLNGGVESPLLLGVDQFVDISMMLVTLRRKLDAAGLVLSERVRGFINGDRNYSFFFCLP